MTLTLTKRMIGAEILKLRRNRGVMAFALLLTSGVVLIAFGWTEVRYASNASQQPPGGVHGFTDGVRMLGLWFGMLAAALIGAEAGTSDRATGVFRDLVVTGRSRLSLFAVRLPAAALVSLAFVGLAYVLLLLDVFLLAGSTATPSIGMVLEGAAWLVLATVVYTAVAVGIGSLTGSRSVTLTAVIGWQTIVSSLLANVSALGAVRDGLLSSSLQQLMPVNAMQGSVTMAAGVAVSVIVAWFALPTLIGAWRTRTIDA